MRATNVPNFEKNALACGISTLAANFAVACA
jgi:lipoprotein